MQPQMLGVPITRFFDTLSTYMGSTFVNDFNILGRTFRVTAQADNPFRLSLRDVENLRTRSVAGDMVPLGSVATFREITGPYRVPRYNLFPAAEVRGDARFFHWPGDCGYGKDHRDEPTSASASGPKSHCRKNASNTADRIQLSCGVRFSVAGRTVRACCCRSP